MKKAVYMMTAALALAAAVVLSAKALSLIKGQSGNLFAIADLNTYIRSGLFSIAVVLTLGGLALVQLKRPTPRAFLFFSGYVFFSSIPVFLGGDLFGLLLTAAGLLPAVYEFMRYSRIVRQEPKTKEKARGLLAAASIIAVILSGYYVFLFFESLFTDSGMSPEGLAFIAAYMMTVAAFCISMGRRTSVLYRMFLISFTVMVLPSIIMEFIYRALSMSLFAGTPLSPAPAGGIIETLMLALAALILIHAAWTQRGDTLPQEQYAVSDRQEGIPASR